MEAAMHFYSLEELKNQAENMRVIGNMDGWDKFKFYSSYLTLGAGLIFSMTFLNSDANKFYFFLMLIGSYIAAAIVYGIASLIQYLYELIF